MKHCQSGKKADSVIAPSDRLWQNPLGERPLSAASPQTLDPARPQPAPAGFRVFGRHTMQRRTGRPTGIEQTRRQRHLLRLLADGATLVDAAHQVGMRPETVLRLLDQHDFRTVAVALLERRADHVTVTVERAA